MYFIVVQIESRIGKLTFLLLYNLIPIFILDLKMHLPSFAQMLEDNPEEHLKAMSVAFHQVYLMHQHSGLLATYRL